MSTALPPILFDARRLRRNRDRAATRFEEYAFLKTRVSSALAERLGDVSRRFPLAMDLGCHTGETGAAILEGGQVGHVLAADPSPVFAARAERAGLSAFAVPLETVPAKEESLDLIVSALSLHWTNDLPGLLAQVRRVLKPDGLFLAALFGAGTLSELRQVLLEAEVELTGGAGARVSPLPGLQDMAGLLQRAGLALPVADIEPITVRYPHMFKLLDDLKGMGERAAYATPAEQGLSRRILMRAGELYQERFADPDGRIRATFQIVWVSGWAPAANQPKPLKPGSGRVSLAQAIPRRAKP